jgi:hypothetical protein
MSTRQPKRQRAGENAGSPDPTRSNIEDIEDIEGVPASAAGALGAASRPKGTLRARVDAAAPAAAASSTPQPEADGAAAPAAAASSAPQPEAKGAAAPAAPAAAASSTPLTPEAEGAAAAASSTPLTTISGLGGNGRHDTTDSTIKRLALLLQIQDLRKKIEKEPENKTYKEEFKRLTGDSQSRIGETFTNRPYDITGNKSILEFAFLDRTINQYTVLKIMLEYYVETLTIVINNSLPSEFRTLGRHIFLLYLATGIISSIISELEGDTGPPTAAAAAASSDDKGMEGAVQMDAMLEDSTSNHVSSQDVGDTMIGYADATGGIVSESQLRHIREILIIISLNLFAEGPLESKYEDRITKMKSITKEIPELFKELVNFNRLEDAEQRKIIDVLKTIRSYLLSNIESDYIYTNLMRAATSGAIMTFKNLYETAETGGPLLVGGVYNATSKALGILNEYIISALSSMISMKSRLPSDDDADMTASDSASAASDSARTSRSRNLKTRRKHKTSRKLKSKSKSKKHSKKQNRKH